MHCVNIWNGFDAQADRVDVKLHTNESGTEVIFTQLHQFSKDEIVAQIKIDFFGS